MSWEEIDVEHGLTFLMDFLFEEEEKKTFDNALTVFLLCTGNPKVSFLR